MDPLVSIGIPVYNRPNGLKRTLTQITNQSYRNTEIIISDNCSTDAEVQNVAQAFAGQDDRIKYVRQTENIGMGANFEFVLKAAKGEYFMWASDDDEWDPAFISTCIENIRNAGGVMQSQFKTIYRLNNESEFIDIPELGPSKSKFINCLSLIQYSQPCLTYGLFKRSSLDFVLKEGVFDGLDIYLPIRVMLSDGFSTFPQQLFTYGVDSDKYILKSVDAKRKKIKYFSEIHKTAGIILSCKTLTFKEKLILSKCHIISRLTSYVSCEKLNYPLKTAIIYRFLQIFIFLNNMICKLTGTINYSIKKDRSPIPAS